MRHALVIAAVIASVPAVVFAREKPTVETVQVTENIYMLQGRGGNLGVLVGDDGVLVIDSDYPGMAEAHLAAIQELGGGRPVFLINTHHHGDHTGGNKAFGETAWIIAHDNVRVRLLGDRTASELDAAERRALPTVTYGDAMTVHFDGQELDIQHYPKGHTDGDSVIFFRDSNVVHLGDHFFVDRFPFVDLSGGGTVQGYLANVRALLDTLPEDIQIIPGHGPLATKQDLRNFEKLIADTVAIIQGYVDEGKSLDEATEAGLPERYDEAASAFINEQRWIGIVYKSLTEQ